MKVGVTTVAFSKNEELRKELLSSFPASVFNEKLQRFTQEELILFLSEVDVAIVGLDQINEEVLSKTPRLKAISKYGVGLNNIDFEACKKYGVKVLHTQGVNRRSVAEQALGKMLTLARNIYITSNDLKRGVWNKDGGVQLTGKTVGIIGVGHIGKDLISLLKPFGCKILVNDIIDQKEYYQQNGLIEVDKETLYKESDFITIHTPFTDETKGLINSKVFQQMKMSAFLINTARGELVKQNDLKKALQDGIIAGAAIDVYEEGEPPKDTELLELPNLICTPHIGGNSKEAVIAMGVSAIENIKNKELNWQ